LSLDPLCFQNLHNNAMRIVCKLCFREANRSTVILISLRILDLSSRVPVCSKKKYKWLSGCVEKNRNKILCESAPHGKQLFRHDTYYCYNILPGISIQLSIRIRQSRILGYTRPPQSKVLQRNHRKIIIV